MSNDQLLTKYLQTIDDIDWMLKVRAASGKKKTKIIMAPSSTYVQRVCNDFWPFNGKELKAIKINMQIKIDKIISEVDINQIL